MKKPLFWCLLLMLMGLRVSAHAQQSNPTAKAGAPDFNGVESVVALIPKTVELKKSGKLNLLAAGVATDALKAGAMGKSGQFKIKIKTIETSGNYGQKYCLVSDADHVTFTVTGSILRSTPILSRTKAKLLPNCGPAVLPPSSAPFVDRI